MLFAASVLWLQGQQIISQPLENDKSIFIYNGDIFGGDVIKLDDIKNDGDTLHFRNSFENANNVIELLTKLEGPYSFMYLNKVSKELYFGRDPYGRRSLLLGRHNKIIVVCSVAKRGTDFEFIELPTIGIFSYNFTSHRFKLFPWPYQNQNFYIKLKELQDFLDINIEIENIPIKSCLKYNPPSDCDILRLSNLTQTNRISNFEKFLNDSTCMKNVLHLKQLLETAVEKRIITQPQFCKSCISLQTSCSHALTGVLFSGGVDCAILALLADKYTDQHRPIDLINVAFDESQNYRTPDRLTGLQTLEELRKLRPDRRWNFLEVNVTKTELNEKRMECIADLIYPLNSILDDSLGCALWFASRGLGDDYHSSCRVRK